MSGESHPFRMELSPAVTAVLDRLRESGHAAHVVGGAVRDALLGLPPGEVDVATDASPPRIEALFPHHHRIGAAFGVVLVVEAGEPIEVATFREEGDYRDGRRPERVRPATLEEDARRRDFTLNALYHDPRAGTLLDPTGGLEDLRARRLRCVGEPLRRFAEDHLRLLRAVRFAAQLDLEIESATWEAIPPLAGRITRISAERVREELERMLRGPHPARALRMLLYGGLLDVVLPEVAAMVGVPQPPEYHPEGDVFVHTTLTLEAVEPRSAVLAWAALLHDVAKPPTYRVAERIRFDGHAPLGAQMAREILERLRCDRHTIERVSVLVHDHLRFLDVRRMRPSTLKRFLRSEGFEEHLALHRADCLASHGDLSHHAFCRQERARLREEELRPAPLLRGQDLLAMGHGPGPLLGRILRAVEDAQLDGRLEDREQAERWVRRRWPPPGAGP